MHIALIWPQRHKNERELPIFFHHNGSSTVLARLIAPGSRLVGFGPGTGEAVAEVRFAQKGISEVFRYGEFAGRTIDEVATGLKAGIIAPSQLPIQVIERGGGLYTLNNRSLMALRLAGVAPTIIRNVTGNPTFEAQLTQRLMEIGREVGEDFVPIIRRAIQP